MVFYFKRMV